MPGVIIEKLSDDKIRERGIPGWPVWEKEVSRFDWEYDGVEECLIMEGEFTIDTVEGTYYIRQGDFVTFREGLKCIWDISKLARKHYNFR